MVILLDTYAMVEIFEGNKKYLVYKGANSATTIFNLFEFYQVVLSKYDKEKADVVFKNYRAIVKEVSDEVLKSAAEFKLEHKKKRFSFTDCIGYKYAESVGAKFLTGDYVFKGFPNVEFVQQLKICTCDILNNEGEDCEPPNTATCDANCKSTCVTSCSNAKNLGSGSISIGGYEASYTCGISSSNTQDWLKITASNNGKLKIELTPPAGYDYDLYVYANDCSTSLCSSVKTGDAVDSCTIDAAATTTYKVKISRYSGSGAAAVSAYLEECFVDSNCPSAKPYCTNNVCVECINNPDGSFTGCLGTDGTQNTYCPKDSPTPNYILPSCDLTLNECQCEAECSTGSECALNFCCTGESLGPSEISGECVQKSTVRNPWLCT